jgi:phage tail sheath protein FI
MAERIVSPGVFTNEKDLSFLPAGIAAIGAAIIGPTLKGPAFVPTVINNFNDFIAKFGGLSEETYVPYAVKSYLKNAGTVTVVRVLQEGGYVTGVVNIIHTSGSVSKLVGTIAPSMKNASSDGKDLVKTVVSPATLSSTGSFAIILSGSGISEAVSGSTLSTSGIRLDKVFGTNVKSSKVGYMYTYFNDYISSQVGLSGSLSFESGSTAGGSKGRINLSGSAGAYSAAATPWITSQTIAGQDPKRLFKIYTLSNGIDTNTAYKISVINTVLPGDDPASEYGTFTLVVRDFTDTDQRPIVLESYNNLTLDPDSANYISRRVGDKYYTINSDDSVIINGDYDNVSTYIRVEVDSDVVNKGISPTLTPFGSQGYINPVSSSFVSPSVTFISGSPEINGSYSKKVYYGFNFDSADSLNYLKPTPNGAATDAVTFNLDSCTIHPSASKVDSRSTFVGGSTISSVSFKGLDVSNNLKFTVALQGGFDGADPAVQKKTGANIVGSNLFGMNCSTANSNGTKAYVKGLNIISNADQYDINLIVTPGATIADHSAIINKAIEVAEDRGDSFVIADAVVQGGSVGSVIAAVANSGIDSNYVGTYWPWVKIIDTDKNKPVWVPPSVVLPNVLAYNDTVAYEWFAPAGLNRGGIAEATDIELKLSFTQRDALYESKINPIATFPNQGICVWGQKTLQAKPSALDRINVRRLMIALKKFIASSTRYLVFENNTNETRQRFLNIVNPYLERVKARQGLYAFRVVMDETNNTPDVIDRNIMYGQIYLQPAKAAEFIVLDFNILPTGASFENA